MCPTMFKWLRADRRRCERPSRKGMITVLAVVCIPLMLAFVAMAVDTGRISLAQLNLQNAVDAAALAASQEITAAVHEAGEAGEYGDPTIDANSIAVQNARDMAAQVASANGVYIDPDVDVAFGKRVHDEVSGEWPIVWGEAPYNVVKVTARRDQPSTSAPDGELRLLFGQFVGKPTVALSVSASAFVEARDLVIVLDFSASMNDDTEFFPYGHSNTLSQTVIEQAQDAMWDALVAANPTWPDTGKSKFPTSGFGGVNSPAGTYVSSRYTSTIFNTLHLGDTDPATGELLYPFPQAGKNSDGTPRNTPSAYTSRAKWEGYINRVKYLGGTYRKKYGYRTLMDYLQNSKPRNNDSEDLWRTPHYPFHGIKEGCSLFLQFLTDLDFGDEVGLVTYDGSSRVETTLNEDGESVDLSANPITDDYQAVDTIQRHKQAGHYDVWTGMGYGIEDARELLQDHGRYGARPTILLMTDGNANRYPSGWYLPSDWNWAELTDYDGDGVANYTTSDRAKQYAFWQAKQAIDSGYTIHTMTVGADADDAFMEAVAFAGGGTWIDVPGGSTIAGMESQLLEAFSQIASKVPPAKLVYGDADAAP